MIEDPFEAPEPLSFPPLFLGQAVTGTTDPFEKACALATLGCDSGVLVHNVTPDTLRAAIVFAPEVPLEQAMSVLSTCGVGFQNALGALAPPEVGVHLKWHGDIMVNGATCGRLRVAASTLDPMAEPDWIVVGLEVILIPQSNENPGETPDETSLFQEGCGDVSPLRLLESWSRHTLVWLNRTESDGTKALHEEWRGLAHGIGDEVTISDTGEALSGTFVGVDEHFGMLLRQGKETRLIPLTSLITTAVFS